MKPRSKKIFGDSTVLFLEHFQRHYQQKSTLKNSLVSIASPFSYQHSLFK